MEWEEGMRALSMLRSAHVCSRLAFGDVVLAMLETLGQDTKHLARSWRQDAEKQIAAGQHLSARTVRTYMLMAQCYPSEYLSREPAELSKIDWGADYGMLRAAMRFDDPQAAIQYALDHEWSAYDLNHAKEIPGERGAVISLVETRPVHVSAGRRVECPFCHQAFPIEH
jgi:hypothetical protein